MRRNRRILGLLGVVGVLVTGGCGSSSKDTAATTTRAPTTVTSPTSTSVPSSSTSTSTAVGDRPQLAVSADGLVFVIGSRSDRFDFGTSDEASTKTALEKALGTPKDVATGQACEDGSGDSFDVVTYPSMVASFVGGKLAGWEARAAGVTTLDGIGVGSTRDDLHRAYDTLKVDPQSSLGVEWSVGDGDPRGLLSKDAPDGRVDAMWAGHVCIIR